MILNGPWIISAAKSVGSFLLQPIVLLLGTVIYIVIAERTKNVPKHWQRLIFIAFCMTWSLVLNFSWRQTRERTIQDFRMLATFMHWTLFHVLVAIAVFAVGAGAYLGKKAHQFNYGVVEVLVAMGTAMVSANGIEANKPDTFSRAATIIGCVYIVSRGLENMNKYAEEQKKNAQKAPAPQVVWGTSRYRPEIL